MTSSTAPLTARRLTLRAAIAGTIRKDMLLEWRGRTRINATLFFAALTLLLFSFAVGPNHAALAKNAAGYLWLALLLSGVMGLTESLRVEAHHHSLEGLRLLPVPAHALFLGKALVNTLFLFGLGCVLVPIAVALYGVTIALSPLLFLPVLLLGTAAFSAPGTLYATITSESKAQDVLLPLLLFPVLVPGLLAAVKASALIFEGDPMGQLSSWLLLLGAFNVIYWVLCTVLFQHVVEE